MTVNDALRDADINHQVDLQQYSNNVVARMIALLAKVEPDLIFQLQEALEQLGAGTFTVERLEQLLASVKMLNAAAYAQLGRELTEEMRQFTEYEAGYQFNLFRSVIPAQVVAQVDVAMISAETVYSAAMSRPFQGRLLRQWASSIEADRMQRIRDAVSIGFAENQSISQIVKRIRGSKAQGYKDGILAIDRRRAETVVRTAISHVAAVTRNRFYQANTDLIKSLSWLSTIDLRTSTGCMLRDGKQYTADESHKPIGHKVPWLGGPGALHWNCFPAGTMVTSSSPIRAVMKRWFDGDLIIINTASGRLVSCTPNHPILTARGWVAAEQVNELDQVVCDGGREWMGVADNDGNNVPARIEDVTEAFLASRGMVAMEVPVAAPYFHGDGAGSDVAVIGADRGLLGARQAGAAEHTDKLRLVDGYALAAVPVSSDGAFGAFFDTAFAAGGGIVRGSGKALDFLWRGIGHAGELLLAAIPGLKSNSLDVAQCNVRGNAKVLGDAADANASVEHGSHFSFWKLNGLARWFAPVFFQNSGNDFVCDGKAPGDRFGRFASVKPVKDGIRIKAVDVAANGNAVALQDGGDGGCAEAKLAANILRGAAGPVFLDDVISVSRRAFSGHVYNLETELGAYTANGIVSHNCRSTAVPVLKSWKELGGADIEDFSPSSRASLDGQIPADKTFGQWIEQQPAGRQDQVLGPTRGKLLRDGKLKFDRLYDEKGVYLDLETLRKRDAEAFKRAGL